MKSTAKDMSSVFARKPVATNPAGEGRAVLQEVTPPTTSIAAVSIPSAAAGNSLGDMLRQISSEEAAPAPQKTAMVSVNVRIPVEVEDMLKRIVGIERYRRSNNFSQQNYLESRLVAVIKMEYAALPKIPNT